MKTYKLLAIAVIILAASCTNNSKDKKSQLNDLIKQRDEINVAINKLKAEMEKSGDSSTSGNIKNIAFTEVAPVHFDHFIEVLAKVDADQSINVNPRMSGSVTQILVKEGDKVSAGQVLATLDDQVIKNSMNELQTQLDFVTNIYNKQKALWDQKIGSEVQYLTAKNNKEAMEKKMATIKEQWDMTKIKSPINGTVDNVAIKIGQMAMPGMPCINVVNLSGVKVKAEVAESYISKIKQGDEVVLKFPDLSKQITATVSYTSSVVNNATRSFTVECRITGSDASALRPNMLAQMQINDYSGINAITAPINVVQSGAEGAYVYTVVSENGKNVVKKNNVVKGISYNGVVELTSGLTAGEKLITAGFQDLNPGDEVKF